MRERERGRGEKKREKERRVREGWPWFEEDAFRERGFGTPARCV